MSHPRIKRDPKVMMGKPVIVGTRITVEHILRCLAAGDSIEHIVANYPHLTTDDIRAAQAFAAWAVEELALPVFFYDDADPKRRSLPELRADAFVKRTSTSRPALGIALEGEVRMARATLSKMTAN